MLGEFKEGKYHFVVVNDFVEDKETGEMRQKMIGLASLEDILEEIIGETIADEKDHRKKRKAQRQQMKSRLSSEMTSELPISLTTASFLWDWMKNNFEIFDGVSSSNGNKKYCMTRV